LNEGYESHAPPRSGERWQYLFGGKRPERILRAGIERMATA
jgi:hypothetical protein